ncbi:membrane protein insertion efficiency factor YidD [Salisediminibacterium beveridgei]|uniref:membrane protein insertion efficiency factor YidD n=1 Tax=Salisediminibacterium beveridgei TaxID=632773 RepID=UPI00084820D9|nr:membrane protein insertion efficiency factor YidD [Salisediminibacterium beveridgei]
MLKQIAIGIIRFYQQYISRYTPPSCRFYPTCSQYGVESIERFGFFKGGFMTLFRVLKCNPFHPGGFDPVPEKKQKHDHHKK